MLFLLQQFISEMSEMERKQPAKNHRLISVLLNQHHKPKTTCISACFPSSHPDLASTIPAWVPMPKASPVLTMTSVLDEGCCPGLGRCYFWCCHLQSSVIRLQSHNKHPEDGILVVLVICFRWCRGAIEIGCQQNLDP